jgi:enoyl-CoA hydratase/carnithine racemase
VSYVDYKVADHVAVIRLDRPDRLNAMSLEMRDDLTAAFRAFNADPEVWVGILTGTGRAFCAGRDLKAQADGYAHGEGKMTGLVYTAENNLFGVSDTDKPLIAAVNGFAIGLGWYMTAACDIRIAAAGAEFAMAEVPTGVLGPYWFALAEMVPWPVAAELALLGDRVPAERLLPLGLLNAVVPAEELMAEAHRWAERFVRLPPAHVQRTKALMTAMRPLPDRDMLARELETRRVLSELADSREAVEAWAEHRTPRYTGQ